MCRTTDLWVWLPVWTGPAEAQNGLVWNVKVMLIILGMWTHHTQKGWFSLQCHKEVSKDLLKNLTYKSFLDFFSPVFSPRLGNTFPGQVGPAELLLIPAGLHTCSNTYGCASCSCILARAAPSANLSLYSVFQQLKVQEEKCCICGSNVVVAPLRKIGPVLLIFEVWIHAGVQTLCKKNENISAKSKAIIQVFTSSISQWFK